MNRTVGPEGTGLKAYYGWTHPHDMIVSYHDGGPGRPHLLCLECGRIYDPKATDEDRDPYEWDMPAVVAAKRSAAPAPTPTPATKAGGLALLVVAGMTDAIHLQWVALWDAYAAVAGVEILACNMESALVASRADANHLSGAISPDWTGRVITEPALNYPGVSGVWRVSLIAALPNNQPEHKEAENA